MTQCCETCKYSFISSDRYEGGRFMRRCRLNPPTPVLNRYDVTGFIETISVHPVVYDGSWCGQYKKETIVQSHKRLKA